MSAATKALTELIASLPARMWTGAAAGRRVELWTLRGQLHRSNEPVDGTWQPLDDSLDDRLLRDISEQLWRHVTRPIAFTLPRPRCLIVCDGLNGIVDLKPTDAERKLLALGRLVLIHTSAGKGSEEHHRILAKLYQEQGRQMPKGEQLKDVWRGVVQLVGLYPTPGGVRLVLSPPLGRPSIFPDQPYGGTPAPGGPLLWEPSPTVYEPLLAQLGTREAA